LFDWITQLVSDTGYLGILGLMLAENVFPPIPSELVMPLAGFVAAQGQLNPVLVVAAGVAGSLLGALPWYYAGLWLGRERICRLAARHGRWLTLDEQDVGKAIAWFEKHGGVAVMLGRVVPAVRTLISVPAGLARMPLVPFLAWSAIGTVAWTALLTAAGYLLKAQYQVVGQYVDAASKIIIGLIVLTYVYRIVAGGRLGRGVGAWARGLRRDIHAIYLAARDPRTPWYAKGLALLIAAYAASPVDLIPDFIPVLGHLDDAILVPLGVMLAIRLIPPDLLEDNRRRAHAAAQAPRDWRIGALFLALWAIATAFALRWLLVLLTGG
jgi:membrane protein DedA with SNARE-associated domain/uncharacterized membrane protein YkvA (DUF1232 family)